MTVKEIKEKIIESVIKELDLSRHGNGQLVEPAPIRKFCDHLRFRIGLDYAAIASLFHKHRQVELPEFEELMMDISADSELDDLER